MHRFYLPPENCQGNTLRLDDRETHHALHVLRLRRGERVSVLNGAGGEFLCNVEYTTKDGVTLAVSEQISSPPPRCQATLFVAIPKGKIIEDIIQKAVELGAHRIVPLLTDRVITHLDRTAAALKREKWQQVAIEAIKQSGATWLPRVETPMPLKESLDVVEKPEFMLVGSLQGERRHPREWLDDFQQRHGRLPRSAGVWIGPEGDFTLSELQAIETAGVKPITLGKLTLRVETAAIYCLSFLSYEFQA